MDIKENLFGWLDYTVFIGMLLISSVIGVFYACKGKQSADDILLGGKSMGVIPVAASIMATFMSATGLLGIPAEQFLYGTQLILSYTVIVMPLMTCMSSYLIVPVFYNLGSCSANEYLEKRFGKPIRGFSCIFYLLTMIFFMGIALYAPALALTQVTGLHVYITVWGGMKAVVWTDTFQTVIMFGAVVWIVVKGIINSGGMGQVWADNWETDRLNFFNFDPSPYTRVTFWNAVLGGSIAMLGAYATNQATIQRYLSLPTLKDAKRAVWVALPMFTIIHVLTLLVGMVVISKYRYCDPIKTKRISTADQLFPLFVMDTMGSIPGIPGIFVAGIFSASLSTVSSGINSLTAVVYEDVIKPYVWPKLTDRQALRLLKVMSVISGILCILAAMVSGFMGNVIQATMFAFGLLGAPMFGTFMLGLFVPFANNKGALTGLFTGFVFNLWMGVGAMHNLSYYPTLEKDYVDGCPEKYFNVSGHEFNKTLHAEMIQGEIARTESIFPIYRISFMYYMLIGVVIVMVIGTVTSFAFGASQLDDMDAKLFVPPIAEIVEKKQKAKKARRIDVKMEEMSMLSKKHYDYDA
ncbi:Sodium-coupled monocarboxylate transporter 1 [Pseudolycoriella hygida]|uniref:Sodium-coupled monocarboxylate transporter 1 n=1 Tax=Pseudolycoriella hygida TaxID=35572 RepID=A0A9Q0MQZ4_9DIPT|nr:Sodium-coupled monocarboxylate transporter 1 [Pseudolycoriella hygida]